LHLSADDKRHKAEGKADELVQKDPVMIMKVEAMPFAEIKFEVGLS